MHLVARSRQTTLVERIRESLNIVHGAYSLVIMKDDVMIAVRDPPWLSSLVLGQKDKAIVAVSETCALDLIDAKFLREVQPVKSLKSTRAE